MAAMPTCILTTADRHWQPHPVTPAAADVTPDLHLGDETGGSWRGWGGCFNELGWTALAHLTASDRAAVLDRLFGAGSDLDFTFCRVPIGANDYSLDWYSHDEQPGDFAMERFSIARDRQHLLPYIHAALARQPDLAFFASPWSPPTWLKQPPVCNYGTLIADDRHYDAYAAYFVRFIQAYAAEGVAISQVHPQNEPVSTQKFPSCVMTGAELARFIGQHLGPALERAGLPTEIWLGTLNGPETDERKWWTTYHHYAGLVLEDRDAARHIRGIAYQWAGKHAVQATRLAHPELPLIQSENECGDGNNTWQHAWYVADLIQHYLINDAVGYVYWNMVLEPRGLSTWGWPQNSLITVDPATRRVIYNPEFHLLRHYAAIRPGARRRVCSRPWASSCVAYRHAGGTVAVLRNPYPTAREITCTADGQAWRIALPAHAIATLHLS